MSEECDNRGLVEEVLEEMVEEVEVSLPCRKGDYDLIGSGEIKCKKPKTWNVEPLGMLYRWMCLGNRG